MTRQQHYVVLFLTMFTVAGILGCTRDEPKMHSDWDSALDEADAAQDEPYTKPVSPKKFTALETNLLVDAPDEIEFSDISYTEIVYPYIIQIKVVEQVDLAAAKTEATKKDTFKEIVTDEPNRLVILVDSYGTDEYLFWINKTLGTKDFTFTNEGRGWTPSTKIQLDWALKMADSIRLDEETVAPNGDE